jgi:hypothetical protein
MTPITSKQAASLCLKANSTFASERCRKVSYHPPYHKIGGRVIYYLEEVQRFIQCRGGRV